MATTSTINAIPVMTSNTTPSGIASAKSVYNSGYDAFKAFTDQAQNTAWFSADGDVPTWLAYEFPTPISICKYSFQMRYTSYLPHMPKNWTFEGSNDNINWVVLDTRTNITDWVEAVPKEFSFNNLTSYKKYRLNISAVNGGIRASATSLKMFETLFSKKVLVFHNNEYKKYNGSTWETVTATNPTESDYLNGNTLEEIRDIPEVVWEQLNGIIEICHYTDENKTEVQFNFETESFYLIDELDEKIIQVIEYTNNPNQTKSEVTLELTEPIMLSDELGNGTVDVLFYSDNLNFTAADLEVEANYNPIDDLNNPTLLVWTDDVDIDSKTININSVPKPKLIVQTQDIKRLDTLKGITASVTKSGYSHLKILISGDMGANWYGAIAYDDGTLKLTKVDPTKLDKVKKYGIEASNLPLIPEEILNSISPTGNYRFSYYLEQYNSDDIAKIGDLIFSELAVYQTPSFSAMNVVYNAIDKKYYGLMFMDVSESYYSTSMGEILKYLDFGTLIAGQTSLEVKVLLRNNYNFNVKDINIEVVENMEGVTIELSKSTNPFVPNSSLSYSEILNSGDTIEFYVRLVTERSATTGGDFIIKVKAKSVI